MPTLLTLIDEERLFEVRPPGRGVSSRRLLIGSVVRDELQQILSAPPNRRKFTPAEQINDLLEQWFGGADLEASNQLKPIDTTPDYDVQELVTVAHRIFGWMQSDQIFIAATIQPVGRLKDRHGNAIRQRYVTQARRADAFRRSLRIEET